MRARSSPWSRRHSASCFTFSGSPNKLIPKDELLDAIWGTTAVTENSLTRAVALLRRVLEDDTREPKFIATVATVGYRFVRPVESVEESSGEVGAKTQSIARDGGEAPATPVSPIVVPVAPAKTKVRARRGLWLTLGSACAIGLAVGFAFTYFLTRPQPVPKVSNYVQLTRDGKQKQLVGADGSRIYLLISVSEHQGLAELSTDGGEPKELPIMPAPTMQVLSLSGDGTKFLVLDGLGFPPRGSFYSLPVARRFSPPVG